MDERAVLAQFQDMVRRGTPAQQAALRLANLYPQFADRLQEVLRGPVSPAAWSSGPGDAPAGAGDSPLGEVARWSPGQATLPVGEAGPASSGWRGTGPARPAASSRPAAPGYYRAPQAAGQDRYGDTMRGNTNAAGAQSNGDDDPWLIGAAEGTTYDPETMRRWYQRARAGDGKAAWVLRQVGFFDEQNRPTFDSEDGLERWASSRKLDRRAAQGSAAPWYHDPKNWGDGEGFTGADDAARAYADTPWAQTRRDDDRPSDWPSRRPRPESVRYGTSQQERWGPAEPLDSSDPSKGEVLPFRGWGDEEDPLPWAQDKGWKW